MFVNYYNVHKTEEVIMAKKDDKFNALFPKLKNIIPKLAIANVSQSEIAKKIGVHPSTMRRWRRNHAKFNRLFTQVVQVNDVTTYHTDDLEKYLDELILTAVSLAKGGEQEITVKESFDAAGKLIGTQRTTRNIPPNTTTLMYLLSNINNELFRRSDRVQTIIETEEPKNLDEKKRVELLDGMLDINPDFFETEDEDEE